MVRASDSASINYTAYLHRTCNRISILFCHVCLISMQLGYCVAEHGSMACWV